MANYRADKPLDLFHADLRGQIRLKTPWGKSYFLLIVDDHKRYMWVEFLTTKDEAFKFLDTTVYLLNRAPNKKPPRKNTL